MTNPVGIEKLHSKNTTLYLRVQHLLRLRKSWEDISMMLDIPNVDELVNWFNEYKVVKLNKFMHLDKINPVPVKAKPVREDPEEMTKKFMVWKRAKEASKEAIHELNFD